MGFDTETLEEGDKKAVSRAIDSPTEQKGALKQVLKKAVNMDSVNKRYIALRDHLKSRFTPEQKDQMDTVLENLKKAHDETLTEMREKGMIGPAEKLAQQYLPEGMSTEAKRWTILGAVAAAPIITWGLLKWFGRKTKETTVGAYKATKKAAVRTTGFFGKALAWTAVGAIGFFGFDHFKWGGATRKKLAGYLSDKEKPPVKDEETTATA